MLIKISVNIILKGSGARPAEQQEFFFYLNKFDIS